MITYKPVKLPTGPIKVVWQTGQKNAGAWVVQLAEGFRVLIFRIAQRS